MFSKMNFNNIDLLLYRNTIFLNKVLNKIHTIYRNLSKVQSK